MNTAAAAVNRRGRPLACAASLSLLCAACDSPIVPPLPAEDVYEFRLTTSPPLTLRWPRGSVVRVFVVEGGAGGEQLRAAFDAGAEAWNQHALLDEYRLAATTDLERADVLLAWSDAPLPVDTAECPRSAGRGVTTFCLNGTGLYRYPLSSGARSSVRMLVTIGAQQAGAAEVVRAHVAHELGHVLGIARHSDNSNDLMWHSDPTRATPSQRDVATVRALYRSPADVQP